MRYGILWYRLEVIAYKFTFKLESITANTNLTAALTKKEQYMNKVREELVVPLTRQILSSQTYSLSCNKAVSAECQFRWTIIRISTAAKFLKSVFKI